MTVKMECVVKHLKHDYRELSVIIAIGILVVSILGVIVYGLPIVMSHGWEYISPYWSAYNVLNVIAGAIVIVFTVGVALFWDKNSFPIGVLPDSNITRPYDTGDVIGVAVLIGCIPYGMYLLCYAVSSIVGNNALELPMLSAITFVALILIGTPIGCAIARCKE